MRERFAIHQFSKSDIDVFSFWGHQIVLLEGVCHKLDKLQRQQQICHSHCHSAAAGQEQLEYH